jgi:hypothetical protein
VVDCPPLKVTDGARAPVQGQLVDQLSPPPPDSKRPFRDFPVATPKKSTPDQVHDLHASNRMTSIRSSDAPAARKFPSEALVWSWSKHPGTPAIPVGSPSTLSDYGAGPLV